MSKQKYPHFPPLPVIRPVVDVGAVGYVGWRDSSGTAHACKADGSPLDPRLDLSNHSPTGYEWGYAGSGPAQLSLAILADHLGDDHEALHLHQRFKAALVASLRQNKPWCLTPKGIDVVIESVREEAGA
jgi:hypothetical protein